MTATGKSPHSEPEIKIRTYMILEDFGSPVVKNPPANAGDLGTTPGLGRSHMLQSN